MDSVQTAAAPAAIGPYSQAVRFGDLVFCSGQIPLDLDGRVVDGGVVGQTHQVLKNLEAVLVAAGSSLRQVLKTTIFLANMEDFQRVNEVYASYFDGDLKPARATVEVSSLPKRVLVEIDCIASAVLS